MVDPAPVVPEFFVNIAIDDRRLARHETLAQAGAELDRLAAQHPGKRFFLLHSVDSAIASVEPVARRKPEPDEIPF